MTCGCSEGLMFGGGSKDTKADWYAKAKKMNIKGRSKMTKDELKKACTKRSSKK